MIEAIRLVNCQSWSDATIHFAPDRINVIQASNNTGKSVLMKILKVSVSPKFFTARKRKKLIRWGASEARAYYLFSDGNSACVVIQPTKVVYLFNGGNGWVSFLEPPKELIEELGILVNSQGSFIANIIDTDQSLLLVDSDTKSTYEFIHMLCNNASLDLYKEKLEESKSWILRHVSDMDLRISSVEQKLSMVEHRDIYQMQESLDKSIAARDMMFNFIDAAVALQQLIRMAADVPDFGKLAVVVEMLGSMEGLHIESVWLPLFDNTVLQVCDFLGYLEGIDLCKVCVRREPPSMALMGVLECLDGLNSIRILKEPPDKGLVNLLGSIEDLCEQVCIALAAFSRLSELEKLFLESGNQYDCPIYGKVVFDGEKCLSDSF